ncbi:type II toxin-antitoxin system prevent-host-death family antitoxin [Pectobacterium aroidearum]|uniref:type II toxin-antitoxin system Phd/YefM family antitoxin n=1 Tax=Pectobacterium aroidearum TaxID=1201031 RepID=UPI0032F071A9
MQKINLYEAKTNFSKIINHVSETGESYIIARNGKPVAKIVPLPLLRKRHALVS